jgi:hypothetical protein
MPNTRQTVEEAVAGILAGEGAAEEAEGTVAEATEPTADDSTTAGGTAEAPTEDGDQTTPAAEEEATPAATGEGTPDDVPTTWMGEDLSEFEPDVRRAFIEKMQGPNKFIQKLLREKAAAEVPETPAPAPAEPEVVTDEAIMVELGLDPDSADDPAVRATVAMARMNLDLLARVEAGEQRSALAETENYWTTSLKALEDQYGALPEGASYESVMETAAEFSIGDPLAAYWAVMGPQKHAISEAVRQRRLEVTEKVAKTQAPVKPRSSTPTTPEVIRGMETADAIKVAFERYTRDKGLVLPEYGDDD